MQFKRATKEQAKLRLALIGLAGSGKSYSALAVGTHLVPGGRVAVIDTERGSASLYADRFAFDVLELERHSPGDYCEAIAAAEEAGYDVIIIDSLSHAWAGKDGALEQVDKIAKREGRSNNFTAWRDVTPQHNRLVDAMLSSKAHVIATMRSKMEYVLEKDEKGKSSVRKVGLAPIQRDGLDYEMSVVGDLNLNHELVISKSRCSAVPVGEIIAEPGEKLARKLREWLGSGVAPAAKVADAPKAEPVADALNGAFAAFIAAIESAQTQADLDRAVTLPGKPSKGAPGYAEAMAVYMARKDAIAKGVAA
jgi:hypothetical protein